MCCLFGFIDYNNTLASYEKNRITHLMGRESEARGIDATGIAFVTKHRLSIYKRPLAAHKIWFQIPKDSRAVMGHTRMTTQGSAKDNFNNHPFQGSCGSSSYALSHNGVLFNDEQLKAKYHLPETNIQTDSYAIVQLLNQQQKLTFESIKMVSEKLEGNFTYTILDHEENIYFIKGNNPLAIYRFPALGIIFYASTKVILENSLRRLRILKYKHSEIAIKEGDILKINSVDGSLEWSSFDPIRLHISSFCRYPFSLWHNDMDWLDAIVENRPDQWDYRDQVFDYARMNGIAEWKLELLELNGYDLSELEDFIYDPNVLNQIIAEIFSEGCYDYQAL